MSGAQNFMILNVISEVQVIIFVKSQKIFQNSLKFFVKKYTSGNVEVK